MNLLNLLPWRRARIKRVTQALDPDYSRYNSGVALFLEGDVINGTWKLVRVNGLLRPVPWEGRK
jgi:hypothetical protein